MRLVVKRWGNGLAVRLPRNSPEIGRLAEGVEVEATVRPVRAATRWKPVVLRSPIPDPSQHIDEIRAGVFDSLLANRSAHGRR